MSDTMKNSLEQQARDILERAGDEHAQQRTAGDVVEIANLLAEIERLRAERERLQSGLRGIRREFGYRSINNGTATLGGFINMLLRNDVAAARQRAENTAEGGEAYGMYYPATGVSDG